MASRCNNCGGTLVYDIALAKVKCQYCDSTFEPESFKLEKETVADEFVEEAAENETPKYTTTIFMCPNCGAETSSTEFDAVDYCQYCGTFVTLKSQMAQVKLPDFILPFSKTKEDCKKAYADIVRGKLYAPKEFRDEKFLESFRGVYIPFWNFEYSFGPQVTVKGRTEERDGDYKNIQEYKTICNISGKLDNAIYDASSNFDDEISLRIAPYDKERMKEFNTSYMFGFFGDTADIKKNVYIKAADQESKQQIWNQVIDNNVLQEEGHVNKEVPITFVKDFNLKKKSCLTMLPVWFLTWRKGDRVAYSVMNGDTGKFYTEIPVDIGRYLLFSLLTAVPIFFGLNMAVTFSASNMLLWAIGLSFLMILLYMAELDKIVRRVRHADDAGYLAVHPEVELANQGMISDNMVIDTAVGIWNSFMEHPILMAIMLVVMGLFATHYLILGAGIAIIGTPIYTLKRIGQNATILRDRSVYTDVAGALLSIIAAAGLLIWDPAPDMPYYLSAAACMLGVAFMAVRMVKRFNEMITRPMPRFFGKRGGVL